MTNHSVISWKIIRSFMNPCAHLIIGERMGKEYGTIKIHSRWSSMDDASRSIEIVKNIILFVILKFLFRIFISPKYCFGWDYNFILKAKLLFLKFDPIYTPQFSYGTFLTFLNFNTPSSLSVFASWWVWIYSFVTLSQLILFLLFFFLNIFQI